ncbi:peroxisome biogenesis protein 3-1-like [Phragmites australis]|uniref:peroxisome biogenesis protein 3-1-like n=1 Tax=Phragmites australis TaxID=29695 RepID=UPI002D768DE6|nr:peroxisome biogenesis protein 3-1-like [Phragmites australis]
MLASARGFWARHRRKILVSLGVAGAGYAAYRLYDAHRSQIVMVEQLRARGEQAADELVKNQLQTHFENVQRISDTTTLPFAMHYLRSRIMEELDISHLTEKLLQGKGESSALTPKEKYDTWEKIKIMSFARTVSSMWAMTLLSLYVRVQVTILGRHLYLDFARGADGAQLLAESDTLSKNGHKDFLATADYLATYSINALIAQMQRAATEVLKEKQLKDPMSMDQVLQTVLQTLDMFMSLCEDNSWINYLVPENANLYAQLMAVSSTGFDDSSLLKEVRKLDQLMSETRIVLASDDFKNIMERSLRKIADVVIEDLASQIGTPIPPSGLPLAKLLARVAQLSLPLLEEPNKNKHIQIIRSMPEVELFYTFLYANMPPET